MTSARTAQSDRIHRECTCPEWVERCAHIPDGRILIIHRGIFLTTAYVCLHEGGALKLDRGLCATDDAEHYTSRAEALAAFHEAEARLLAGGAE